MVEFEQFRQKLKGKALAAEQPLDEILSEGRKRRQDGCLLQPIRTGVDKEATARKKSCKINDQGHLRSITYQDPLIHQELDSAIGVDDDDVVNIALQPHILNAALLPGFKWPSIKPYDGMTYPKVFLNNFKFLILSRGGKPIHMCKLFPKYLMDSANIWFNELPANCISNFRELGTAFTNKFFRKCVAQGSGVDILNVR